MSYFQIDNHVTDELMCLLTGNEFKVYMAILRKTIGWHKTSDAICNEQLKQLTGITKRQTIYDAIKALVAKKLIKVIKQKGKVNVYELVPKNGTTNTQDNHEVVPKKGTRVVPKKGTPSSTQKRYTQKTLQKTLTKDIVIHHGENDLETQQESEPMTTKTNFPKAFEFLPSHIKKCKKYGMNIQQKFDAFESHHVSKGSKFVDWSKAFHTWLNNAIKFDNLQPVPQVKLYQPEQTQGDMDAGKRALAELMNKAPKRVKHG